MPSIDVFAVIGIILVFILLAILFFIPSGKKKSEAKKQRLQPEEAKDWQAVSLKLEKHIHSLHQKMDEADRQKKTLERELSIQKEKYAKLQEKLTQERGWQEKEQNDLDKKNKEILKIKDEFKQQEEDLEKEHRQRLEYERQIKTLKDEYALIEDAKRSLEKEISIHKGQAEVAYKEIKELRAANQKLSQKQDDVEWIAKTEYIKLEKRLEAAIKEVERLRKPAS